MEQNIAAQKTRGNENIDYGEAIAAGLIQMIPFGSTAKGVKGVAGAAVQGSVTSIGDQQIQKAINEQRLLTKKELRDYGAFGAIFGTGFKGSIDAGSNYNVTQTTTAFRARNFEDVVHQI